MKIITFVNKVREKGIKGCVESLQWHCSNEINKCFFYHYQKENIDEKLIVFESGGEITDNAYALYDYMGRNGYLDKYHVVWLVYEIAGPRKEHKIQHLYPNTKIIWGRPSGIHKEWDKCLATCKWYIYDHSNMMANMKKRNSQTLIYLCHGFAGYKAGKGEAEKPSCSHEDFINVTGDIPEQVLHLYRRNLKGIQIEQLGFPRLDYFYYKNDNIKEIVEDNFHFSLYSKIFLWMPTFRQSVAKDLSEDYQTNETKLPLLSTFESVAKLNSFLITLNSLVILKIHHLQKDEPIFKQRYSNIIFLSDEDIQKLGMQLYQFIPFTDALITDYSSISADYMLLDEPMIFIIDDYDDYNKSRGIIPPNAKELWTGDHVYNVEDLKRALQDVVNGKDNYRKERNQLLPHFYKYLDGNASQRILNFYGIK